MRGFSLALFAMLRRVTAWRKLHLTVAGNVALLVQVATPIGFNAHETRLGLLGVFAAAALAIAAPFAVVFPRRHRPLGAERMLPKFASVGTPLTYSVVLHNGGRHPLADLTVFDRAFDRNPDAALFRDAREPGESRRNGFDRVVGFYRWSWLARRACGVTVMPGSVPLVPAGGTAELRLQAMPLRRGVVRFREIIVGRADPLGLVRGLVRVPRPQSLLVLPRCHPMSPILLSGSRRPQPGGVAEAQSVGHAEEFLFLRDFRTGDSRRHIHWRSSARRGELVVKETRDEYHQRHALIVDTFAGPGQQELFEEALSASASVLTALGLGEALIDMMFIGAEACCVTAGRGVGTIEHLLEILACATPCRDRSVASLKALVLGHAAGLCGSLCVLLDWDEPRRALVTALLGLGLPVRVLLILAAEAPTPDPGPLSAVPDRFTVLRVGALAAGLAALR